MSIFSYPRIHVKGMLEINVGTGNNDDFSSSQFPKGSLSAGQALRLADSDYVRPNTFGMSDDAWIKWVQTPSLFVKPAHSPPPGVKAANTVLDGDLQTLLPAEWNYYGDMSVRMIDVLVTSVSRPDRYTDQETEETLIGAELSFSKPPSNNTAVMVDINAEDTPCSQIFSNFLTLQKGDVTIFSGTPSKAVTRGINFFRNLNLQASGGAGCGFQSVVPLEEIKDQPIVKHFVESGVPLDHLRGLVFRYYIYRSMPRINGGKYPAPTANQILQDLYINKGTNPTYVELIGTIAPLYDSDMNSTPTGRLLVTTGNAIALPPGSKGNATAFPLAPAMFRIDWTHNIVSIDFSGTFPDRYLNTSFDPLSTNDNPKFDFGPVSLVARLDGKTYTIGSVPYLETSRDGGMIDLPLRNITPAVRKILEDGNIVLVHRDYGDLLSEKAYLIVSDQSCIIGEQSPTVAHVDRFVNDRYPPETATIQVFHKGHKLSPNDCPDITVWQYTVTPNNTTSGPKVIIDKFKPGDPLLVDATLPGNRLFTFTIDKDPPPPAKYSDLDQTSVPMINLRILPNDKDFSSYYVDPKAREPIGNDLLTFDVIFREVFHNYYLLYPAMSALIPLNDQLEWDDPEMARRVMTRTSTSLYPNVEFMPRTRDLSDSRRQLLHAWCRKLMQ